MALYLKPSFAANLSASSGPRLGGGGGREEQGESGREVGEEGGGGGGGGGGGERSKERAGGRGGGGESSHIFNGYVYITLLHPSPALPPWGHTSTGGKQVPLRSKVFFVGTHKDKVSQKQISRIDRCLQQMVRSTGLYREGMIQFASESQMLLAVTASGKMGGGLATSCSHRKQCNRRQNHGEVQELKI